VVDIGFGNGTAATQFVGNVGGMNEFEAVLFEVAIQAVAVRQSQDLRKARRIDEDCLVTTRYCAYVKGQFTIRGDKSEDVS
jgi:hypothetical protein